MPRQHIQSHQVRCPRPHDHEAGRGANRVCQRQLCRGGGPARPSPRHEECGGGRGRVPHGKPDRRLYQLRQTANPGARWQDPKRGLRHRPPTRNADLRRRHHHPYETLFHAAL